METSYMILKLVGDSVEDNLEYMINLCWVSKLNCFSIQTLTSGEEIVASAV